MADTCGFFVRRPDGRAEACSERATREVVVGVGCWPRDRLPVVAEVRVASCDVHAGVEVPVVGVPLREPEVR